MFVAFSQNKIEIIKFNYEKEKANTEYHFRYYRIVYKIINLLLSITFFNEFLIFV